MSMLPFILGQFGFDPKNLPSEDEIKGVFEALKNVPETLARIEEKLSNLTDKE